MKTILLALIRLYRFCISPLFPPSCRFHPSCSAYSLESIERFGLFHGSWLSLKRILKCHPWNCGGFDPVPETDPKRES